MPSYVVVGGSRGIGLEFVRQLSANADNTVIAVVRNKAKIVFLEEILKQRSNIHVVEADVVDADSLKAAAAETAKITGGSLDVLVHNAARTEKENAHKSFLDYPSDEALETEFVTAFRVNVLGIIYSVNAFLPLLRQGSTKRILVISTAGGDVDTVRQMKIGNMSAYGTTRAGSNMVVAKWALLLADEGFFVVGVSPGIVDCSATSDTGRPAEGSVNAAKEIRKLVPGFKPLTPQQSVEKILELFEGAGPEDNGTLLKVPL